MNPPGSASRATYRRQTYVVQPHDTLYSIAWRHDVDYRDLARWNGIGADFRLAIGEVLLLQPPPGSKPVQPPPRALPPIPGVRAAPSTGDAKPPSAGANEATETPHAVESDSAAIVGTKWAWPTDPTSAPRPVPGGGILLFGRLGQDVRAAGSGRVVYTGSGLRGYGNLIIIKHGETVLTSYAHNEEMLVHEGQQVSVGQLIARMGTGPHQVCALYFEIRVNGKPTDPVPYLPTAR